MNAKKAMLTIASIGGTIITGLLIRVALTRNKPKLYSKLSRSQEKCFSGVPLSN